MRTELQLDVGRLLTLVQSTLTQKIGSLVVGPSNLNGVEYWIQSISLTGSPALKTATGVIANILVGNPDSGPGIPLYFQSSSFSQDIFVSQNITLHAATRNGAQFTPAGDIQLIATFMLGASYDDTQGLAITFTPTANPLQVAGGGPLQQLLQGLIDTNFGGILQPIRQSIPISVFLLGGKVESREVELGSGTHKQTTTIDLLNYGLALSADERVLALRVETQGFPRNNTQPWDDFFKGNFASYMDTAGSNGFVPSQHELSWVLYVDSQRVTGIIDNELANALHDVAQGTPLEYPPFATLTWSAPNGHPHIHAGIYGYYDTDVNVWVADPEFSGEVSATVDLEVSVPDINTVQIDASYSADATVGPIDLGFVVQPVVESVVNGFINSSSNSAGALKDLFSFGPYASITNLKSTGDASFQVTGRFTMPAEIGDLRDVLALPDALLLMGSRKALPEFKAPRINVVADDFQWVPVIGCANLYNAAELAKKGPAPQLLVGAAVVTVTNNIPGSSRVLINDVWVLDDSLGYYSESYGGSANQYSITIGCSYVSLFPASGARPQYPARLAIFSSAGTVLSESASPQALSDGEIKKLIENVIRAASSNCNSLQAPWVSEITKAKWLVDPGDLFPGEQLSQYWGMALPAGSQPGTVRVSSGEKVIFELATTVGEKLSLPVVTGMGGELNIETRYTGAGRKQMVKAASTGRLQVGQALMGKSSEWKMGHAITMASLIPFQTFALLAVATASRLFVYDLRSPSNPTLVFSDGLSGVTSLAQGPNGSIFAGGDFGLMTLDYTRGGRVGSRLIKLGPVQSLARIGKRWFASTADGIAELDENAETLRMLKRPRGLCGSLNAVGSQLVWSGSTGISLYSPCTSSTWESPDSGGEPTPSSLQAVLFGNGRTLFEPAEKGGRLWSLNGSKLVSVGRFAEDPWFHRGGKVRSVIATTNRTGTVSVWSVMARKRS